MQVILMMVNRQVNPLDLVQIEAKHEIWQVQNIRQRSQVHRSQVQVIALCKQL